MEERQGELMKNILVVGGAGYIGGLTTDILLERGHNVTVFDNLMYESRYLKDCDFIYGDIRNTDHLVNLQKKYDEIIWLAAIVGDGACAQSPDLTREINLNSIRRFLERTERRLIFASTCSVYGAQHEVLNEESPTDPLSLYASTKLEAESHVLKHGGTVFRLGTVYGVGDQFSRIRLDLVINVLTLKALQDHRITVFGGDQWRPVIAVRDVAHYFGEAVTRDYSDVFILKYKNLKIIDLAHILQSLFPDIEVEVTEMKFQDLRSYQVDSSKAGERFIFKPKTTIEAEVTRLKLLFEDHRIKDVNDDIYYNTKFVKALLDHGTLPGDLSIRKNIE